MGRGCSTVTAPGQQFLHSIIPPRCEYVVRGSCLHSLEVKVYIGRKNPKKIGMRYWYVSSYLNSTELRPAHLFPSVLSAVIPSMMTWSLTVRKFKQCSGTLSWTGTKRIHLRSRMGRTESPRNLKQPSCHQLGALVSGTLFQMLRHPLWVVVFASVMHSPQAVSRSHHLKR